MKATAAIHCSIAIQLCVSWANVRVSTTLYTQGRHGWQGPRGIGLAWILQNRKRQQWHVLQPLEALPTKNWSWRP